MHIAFIEISNFRKLLAIRVDLEKQTTVLVGANNSGKTSAMLALRKFLSSPKFEKRDVTLSCWPGINAIGQKWLDARSAEAPINLAEDNWAELLPALDLWLHVGKDELHRVRDLIPTLDWEGGLLGVRLRLEPKNREALYKEFLDASANAAAIAEAARAEALKAAGETEQNNKSQPPGGDFHVWPTDLIDFLDRRFKEHLAVCVYPLDPSKITSPTTFRASPQSLAPDALPVDSKVLDGLIRVDEIAAQRGLRDGMNTDGVGYGVAPAGNHRLSDQLRTYYEKHLDPMERPDPKDLGALQAIATAEKAFNDRLEESFEAAFNEVQHMGYPGVTDDPRPRVSTQLKATDGLNHSAAVSFMVAVQDEDDATIEFPQLPEDNNGLGYQNLISMIFQLMSFRDSWMRVGKAAKLTDSANIEPIHLVLVEEPEAHLHAQVQQVFIRKAYEVLRTHSDLGRNEKLQTQLIVSTHSSHIAHEVSFQVLRYFRRLPAGLIAKVPASTVVNLSEVFGTEHETERFVTRYLHTQHADLFFADAAILVEGPAERMLLPHFIRTHHPVLHERYISLLEIGGSHAHRLRPLIEHLGMPTLVITDIDTLDKAGQSVQPERGANQVTNNATLKGWIPGETDVDRLLDADESMKGIKHDELFAIRVAYQFPLKVTPHGADSEDTAYPYTFEDALAFENLAFFSTLPGSGLAAKFREAINSCSDVPAIGKGMFEALKRGKKAEFALDIIDAERFEVLTVPRYISEGLTWLEEQLEKKQQQVLRPTEEELE